MEMTKKNRDIFMKLNFNNNSMKLVNRQPIFINALVKEEYLDAVCNYFEFNEYQKKEFFKKCTHVENYYEIAYIGSEISDETGLAVECYSAILGDIYSNIYVDKSIIKEKFWYVYEVSPTVQNNAADGMNKLYEPVREYFKNINMINLSGFEDAVKMCRSFTYEDDVGESTADKFIDSIMGENK